MNALVESDEFVLAGFADVVVDTQPVVVALFSSSTGGEVVIVPVSSSATVVLEESGALTNNEFKWSSLAGALAIIAILALIIGVLYVVGRWLWMREQRSRTGFAKGAGATPQPEGDMHLQYGSNNV